MIVNAHMIKIAFDETKLEPFDLSFLRDWASNLDVSLEVLFSRILTAAVVGKHYLTGNPAQAQSLVRPSPGTVAQSTRRKGRC